MTERSQAKIAAHDTTARSSVRDAFAAIVNVGMTAAVGRCVRDVDRRQALVERLGEAGHTLGKNAYVLIRDKSTATDPEEFGDDLLSGVTTAIAIADSAPSPLPTASAELWLALLAWLASRGFGGGPDVEGRGRLCRQRFYRWGLDALVVRAFIHLGLCDALAWRRTTAVAAVHSLPMWRPDRLGDPEAIVASWLANGDVRATLGLPSRSPMAAADEESLRWFIRWTSWVAAIRLVEYPIVYGLAEPPILDWVARISAGLTPALIAARLDAGAG